MTKDTFIVQKQRIEQRLLDLMIQGLRDGTIVKRDATYIARMILITWPTLNSASDLQLFLQKLVAQQPLFGPIMQEVKFDEEKEKDTQKMQDIKQRLSALSQFKSS